MRYYFVFILLSFVCIDSPLAQQTQIDWGQIEKLKGGNRYKFIGVHDSKYSIVCSPDKDNLIRTYNLNNVLLSEEKFDYVVNRDLFRIDGSIKTKSGFYIYMHQYSDKYKEWIIHASKYQGNKFAEPKEVYFQEVDIEKKRLSRAYSDYLNQRGDVFSDLQLSKDSSKVAFVKFIKRTRNSQDDVLLISVFDDKMNQIWKDVFYYKFGEKSGEVKQVKVTNAGEIYLVSENDLEDRLSGKVKSRKEKNLPSTEFVIYHINQEGILDNPIDLGPGLAPVDAAMFFPTDNTDQYLLGGFYTTDDHRANRRHGVFFTYGDREFSQNEIKTHKFDEALLEDLEKKKSIKKGKGLKSNFIIKDMLQYENGNIGFLAEETDIQVYYRNNVGGFNNGFNTVNNMNTRQEVVYHTDDIIIPMFDQKGNLLSIQKIIKDFNSQTYVNTSYSLAVNNNKTYIIFNDNKRQSIKQTNKKGRLFTELVVIDENGIIERREELFTNKEIDLYFTTEMTGFNNRKMLIGTIGGRKYQLGTINFDN